jgi:serine/threonine protein kinase
MDSAYSEKSDVWAIGMIFYEMLIGKPLTVGKDIEDIYTYIHRGKQFIPNGISDLSKTIISSCLRYSRHQRMGIYDLERLLNSNINPATYSTSNQFPLFSN